MPRTMRFMALAAAAALISGCIHIYEPRPAAGTAGPQASAGAAPGGAPATAAPKPEASPFKPWDDVLKDTKPFDGYIKLHRKRDNTLFFEVRPDQIDKDFGLMMHISKGTGVFNLQDGLYLSESRLMRFRRTGDKLYLLHINDRFTADAGSPMLTAMNDNVGHSIVAAFKIESEHKETKAVLVDATPFLVSDYAQLGDWIKWYYGNKPVMFDRERSYVDRVQAFPKNDEIDALLTYRASDFPVTSDAGVSDFRSIPVGVRYSMFALPEKPMQKRLFDDRVGYFTNAIRDFSRDKAFDPYVRLINRWRLEKKDPNAEKSEPVTPIVYYIDTSVPKEYRPYVKQSIEDWNKAFAKAGFINAIVAKEAPENDSTWSAEDMRYATIRWTAAHQMGYAIGPSQTDPRTGEILNADILISSEFTRGWASTWQTLGTPEAMAEQIQRERMFGANLAGSLKDRLCMMESGMTLQMGLQYEALLAMDMIEPGAPMPEVFVSEALRELLMHEIGHTLGLRHNMKGSSAIPYDKLQDKEFTRKHGLTLSVMDYAPVNIAANSKQQGHYYSTEVGSYDEWAIEYGYSPVYQQSAQGPFVKGSAPLVADAEAERVALRKIASLAADPMHMYGTDEDTHLGPQAVDPNSNTWDLGSDPLRYAADRIALYNMIQPKLESRLIADGDAYNRLRGSVSSIIFNRYNSLAPVTKVIGGMYFARDHVGDPNGRMPFTPVSAARQREALKLITDNAFAENTFKFDAKLLNKLAPSRSADWSGSFIVVPIDYPIHSMVGTVQGFLLQDLLDSYRLARMIDNGVRMPNGAESFTVNELFETLTNSIWSEVGGRSPRSIDSFRRNLQRKHLDQMTRIVNDVRPMGMGLPVPEDARSLARYDLTRLAKRIDNALDAQGLDTETKAHLAESRVRIERALEAQMTMVPR